MADRVAPVFCRVCCAYVAAGMKCGGCVGHVKQLLEQHPSVTTATVNLATETALVRVKLEAGAELATLAADLAKVSRASTGWK
jgi:Cu2+-exporting ATPase